MRTLEYKIPCEYNEKRVLSFLKSEAGLSSRLIRALKMHENGLLLNGVHVRTVDILHEGDILTVNIPGDDMDEELCRYDVHGISEERILYEDDDLIALNKPAMLAIHPSHNHQGDTLANLLAGYLKSKNKKAVFRAASSMSSPGMFTDKNQVRGFGGAQKHVAC